MSGETAMLAPKIPLSAADLVVLLKFMIYTQGEQGVEINEHGLRTFSPPDEVFNVRRTNLPNQNEMSNLVRAGILTFSKKAVTNHPHYVYANYTLRGERTAKFYRLHRQPKKVARFLLDADWPETWQMPDQIRSFLNSLAHARRHELAPEQVLRRISGQARVFFEDLGAYEPDQEIKAMLSLKPFWDQAIQMSSQGADVHAEVRRNPFAPSWTLIRPAHHRILLTLIERLSENDLSFSPDDLWNYKGRFECASSFKNDHAYHIALEQLVGLRALSWEPRVFEDTEDFPKGGVPNSDRRYKLEVPLEEIAHYLLDNAKRIYHPNNFPKTGRGFMEFLKERASSQIVAPSDPFDRLPDIIADIRRGCSRLQQKGSSLSPTMMAWMMAHDLTVGSEVLRPLLVDKKGVDLTPILKPRVGA